ncbi:unnamed protein product [Echinostoma caproni]|uniref:GST C-terminal domain-containing protein n=1 Tax=Echinostoma caproni TaxID=27848 RepID=A0A183B441_9TREM|nr:unnamed protein product [Echinostoma caproni]
MIVLFVAIFSPSTQLPIIEYLEETRGSSGVSLLPKDPVKRAHVRRLSEIINSGIQPMQNLSVMRQLPPEVNRDQWHIILFHGCFFTAFEKELEKLAGKYCVGDELSMADVCLVPQVYNAFRFKVDLSPYPIIRRIYTVLMEVEAFKKAAPDVQPDSIG